MGRKNQARCGQAKKGDEGLLKSKAEAAWGGTIRVPTINVLEINLALNDRYSSQVISNNRTRESEAQ